MLRFWFACPDSDPCLLLVRQSLAGTIIGKKDALGVFSHQLLTSSKFSFSSEPIFVYFVFILPNLICISACLFEAGFYIPLQSASITLRPH